MSIFLFLKHMVRHLSAFLLAVALVVFSYSAMHPLHAYLIEKIVGLAPGQELDSAALVSIQPSLAVRGDWQLQSGGFNAGISASLYETTMPLPVSESVWQTGLAIFRRNQSPVSFHANVERWQPTEYQYKTLLSQEPELMLVDAIALVEGAPSYLGFNALSVSGNPVELDLFGGGYLLHNRVPEPILIFDAVKADYRVDRWSPSVAQFVREHQALTAHLWVVTPSWMFILAGLFVCLPWWLSSLKWHAYVMAVVCSGFLLGLAVFWVISAHWWLPVMLPLLSTIVAAMNKERIQMLTREIARFQGAYGQLGERWVHRLLDDAKPDMAFRFLSERQPPLTQVQLWLDTGQGFERNRELDKAQQCYQAALLVDDECTEARSRLRQLTTVIDGTKTVALSTTRGELPVGKIANLSLGRYQLQSEVGRGAMGIVYEAIDPKIDRKLALKVVHLRSLGLDEVEQVKQRFFREAQAAGKLNHPHIVTVYDVGEEHDVAYIAMDFLHGFSLAQHIANSETINLVERTTWIAQAAEALSYAHDHDVIHRDVKPANMIIDERQRSLKLTDFGVARIAGVQQTQTGIVLGSPSYMSPEQIRGETLTGQTDVFSLGVALYQAITGVLPFVGETLPALAYAITQSKQVSPRVHNELVPVSLVRIVNKALQKSTQDRYQNSAEFALALRKWLAENSK